MKKNNKYNYLQGTQIMDQGSRIYDVAGYRLPSVTTVLGKTKNQQFLKDWKAKVGEAEAERIKNLSSKRGTSMHKFLEHYILGTGYDDLTGLGQEAKAMAEKIIDVGLTPVEEYYGRKLRYTIRAYTQVQQILYAYTMAWKLLLTLNRPIVQRRKSGLKIIIYKSQHTPWRTTTSTTPEYNKELSWYARLTYIIKNLS